MPLHECRTHDCQSRERQRAVTAALPHGRGSEKKQAGEQARRPSVAPPKVSLRGEAVKHFMRPARKRPRRTDSSRCSTPPHPHETNPRPPQDEAECLQCLKGDTHFLHEFQRIARISENCTNFRELHEFQRIARVSENCTSFKHFKAFQSISSISTTASPAAVVCRARRGVSPTLWVNTPATELVVPHRLMA
jgi:hypothetical protein